MVSQSTMEICDPSLKPDGLRTEDGEVYVLRDGKYAKGKPSDYASWIGRAAAGGCDVDWTEAFIFTGEEGLPDLDDFLRDHYDAANDQASTTYFLIVDPLG